MSRNQNKLFSALPLGMKNA